MAGLGFKDFQVGEVLTAADVDGYLMQQTVMRFADAGARGSALGTAVGTGVPLAEGMVSYLDDVNTVQVYDGSAWANVGSLIAVKSAIFTGTQSASVSAGGNLAITDLSITHEVADAGNRLIISAFIGAAANADDLGNVGLAIYDGTAFIGVGDADGSRVRVGAGGYVSDAFSNVITTMPSVTFVHTPGSGSKTYTARAMNIKNGSSTLYINRTEDDTNSASRPRAASSLVIMEVSV